MSWLVQKRKSPKPSPRPSPSPGLISSGSEERPPLEVRLRCDEGGLKNPLAWGNIPAPLQKKFPHWKENSTEEKTSKHTLTTEDDRSIHFSSSFKAPDFTIPYMVMDNDTVNSIAIKFETTPSDIARINRKHQGPSFLIFPGDVIYVPDIENMPKSSPSPPSKSTHITASEAHEDSEASEGSGAHETNEKRGATPFNWSTDEVADTHLSIVCRFISDDQGCIHGSLVVNHMTLMFQPHPTDPLVMEHGPQRFEIVLPIQDITYAALTRDITIPMRQSHTSGSSSEGVGVDSEGVESVDLDLSLDKINVGHDGVPVITFRKATPDDEAGEASGGTQNGEGGGDGDSSEAAEKEINSIANSEVCEASEASDCVDEDSGEATPHNTSNEGDQSITTTKSNDETPGNHEDLTSTAPPGDHEDLTSTAPPGDHEDLTSTASHKLSVEDLKDLLSDEGVDDPSSDEVIFLHTNVTPKPGTTYTYTPINNAVGIDIPMSGRGSRYSRSPSVQQVKTWFCFAFAQKRAHDLVGFILSHHAHPLATPPLRQWTNGPYELINCGAKDSSESLNFCEDHFENSSWEIMSLQDLYKYRRRLSALEEMDLPPPILSESSQLLEEGHLKKLVAILPASAVSKDWSLVYSTFRDGISLRTLYRNMAAFDNEDSAVVLVVRDDQQKVFGAVTTCPLRISEKFYGRGESSLFSFVSPSEMQHYYWSGTNHYFVKGNSTSLSIGSGDGHPGLWIDENFYHGSSYECSTFNNQCLASSEDFICTGVEAWGFL